MNQVIYRNQTILGETKSTYKISTIFVNQDNIVLKRFVTNTKKDLINAVQIQQMKDKEYVYLSPEECPLYHS